MKRAKKKQRKRKRKRSTESRFIKTAKKGAFDLWNYKIRRSRVSSIKQKSLVAVFLIIATFAIIVVMLDSTTSVEDVFRYDWKITVLKQEQQQTEIPAKTSKTDYIRTYDFWIQGIGNEFMWNNESGSTCLFEPNEILVDESIAFHHGNVQSAKHDKNEKRFSAIMDRMITVKCSRDWKYYQQQSVVTHKKEIMDESITEWATVSKEEHILHLDDLTQVTFIKCGGQTDLHFSVLPLSTLDPALYEDKKRVIKENFGQQRLPNIALFVMDSVSRAAFHRGCPDTMHLLSEMMMNRNGQTKSDIFEFHRHSTVGWGTYFNLYNGLVRGNCAAWQDGCPDRQHNMTLGDYYDAMGYYDISGEGYGKIALRDPVRAVQYVKQALKQQQAVDDGVPYFILIHESSNHGSNNQGIHATDEVIHELIESIDFDKTMLNLVSDHGTLIGGGVNTFHGRWEQINPMNIMLIPKWFAKDIDTTALKINEQRLVSHYDTHRFYKEILWKLYAHNDNLTLYDALITETIPFMENMDISMDILNEIVPVDRSCDGIMRGYCVCHTVQKKALTHELIKEDAKYLQQIIDAINKVTGDGNWHCQRLNVADFEISQHFEAPEGDAVKEFSMKLTVQQIVSNEEEKKALLKANRLLTYTADFERKSKAHPYVLRKSKNKHRGYDIDRLSWFKFENCTQNDPNKFAEGSVTKFVDEQMQNKLDESGVVYNLRLCKCK